MTARRSEIAQVRCKCLPKVDVAAIRRVTQQVNTFFCQNLGSKPFPNSYWKFVDCRDARDQRDAWPCARRSQLELVSDTFIGNCSCAVRDASWALDWLLRF